MRSRVPFPQPVTVLFHPVAPRLRLSAPRAALAPPVSTLSVFFSRCRNIKEFLDFLSHRIDDAESLISFYYLLFFFHWMEYAFISGVLKSREEKKKERQAEKERKERRALPVLGKCKGYC